MDNDLGNKNQEKSFSKSLIAKMHLAEEFQMQYRFS